jgi:HlyD family secretion protein
MKTLREMAQKIGRRWGRVTAVVVALVLVVVGLEVFGKKADASDYMTANVARQTVETTVSATGTLQAVTTVQVGSQASGTVAWLGADFNSTVKKGQVIARLDPSTLQAQVDSARASLASAEAAVQAAQTDVTNQQANVKAAEANVVANQVQAKDAEALVARYQQISDVMAQRDIEAARAQANTAAAHTEQASAQVSQARAAVASSQAKVAQANAQVEAAKAQLDQALASLAHTEIASPIDGIVVSRSVDVGQTVAASLQAPTLFTIAADLKQMQVLASIDEADVGPVHEGLEARFTVDAFPGDNFTGRVSQVRLNAQAVQNVVTYTAVIEVANEDGKLKPGMTTNLTIPTASRENALTVPNAALRFKPTLTDEQQQALRAQAQARRDAHAQGGAGAADGPKQSGGDQAQGPSQAVWVLVDGKQLTRRSVRTGLTDGRVTEIVSGDLKEGDVVVTGQTSGSNEAAQPRTSSSPFGQRGGLSGGRPSGGR